MKQNIQHICVIFFFPTQMIHFLRKKIEESQNKIVFLTLNGFHVNFQRLGQVCRTYKKKTNLQNYKI